MLSFSTELPPMQGYQWCFSIIWGGAGGPSALSSHRCTDIGDILAYHELVHTEFKHHVYVNTHVELMHRYQGYFCWVSLFLKDGMLTFIFIEHKDFTYLYSQVFLILCSRILRLRLSAGLVFSLIIFGIPFKSH